MKWFLLMLSILFLSASLATATIYSCRDKSGKLFVSDNIQSLPAECRDDQQQITYRDDPGNVNYVPAAKIPTGSGPEFEQAVQSSERDLQQKKALEEGLLSQAQHLAEQYQQALSERRNATRRWKYAGSRDVIRRADEMMDEARAKKEQLLSELQEKNISLSMKQEITNWLDKVGE